MDKKPKSDSEEEREEGTAEHRVRSFIRVENP